MASSKEDSLKLVKKSLEKFLTKYDKNYLWLFVTIVIALLFFAIDGVAFSSINQSFGYCNFTTNCKGIGTSEFCIGQKELVQSCRDPWLTSTNYPLVEYKCSLWANQLCKNSSIGENWSQYANYANKTCQKWQEEDSRIKLISCDQTFVLIDEYENIR